MNHPESDLQRALLKWWAMAWRGLGAPDERVLFAIPNGGARHIATARRMKLEGVRAGVPDLFLALPGARDHGLWLELKSRSGRVSEAQAYMQAVLFGSGYTTAIARSLDEAVAIISARCEVFRVSRQLRKAAQDLTGEA